MPKTEKLRSHKSDMLFRNMEVNTRIIGLETKEVISREEEIAER